MDLYDHLCKQSIWPTEGDLPVSYMNSLVTQSFCLRIVEMIIYFKATWRDEDKSPWEKQLKTKNNQKRDHSDL